MKEQRYSLADAALTPLLFVLAMWAVFYANIHYGLNLNEYGLRPRSLIGLIGIFTIPFLHSDLGHILSNTFPILILGTLLFYHYREIATKVFLISTICTGILVWLFGETGSIHIGASGVLYAMAGFLFFSGILRRHKMLFGVSLLITFLYGTIVWGVLPPEILVAIHYAPEKMNISWEGHLFGALSGIGLAFVYRKKGLQEPVYEWQKEEDNDPDDSNPYWMVDENGNEPQKNDPENELLKNTSDNPYTVHYTFVPKEKKADPPKDPNEKK